MKKNYNNRAMTTEVAESNKGEVYFFPKNKPPVSIRANSREEAESILKALNK